jgi:hypothetical protein
VDLETRQPVPPREASPFPLTSAGEIDLRQKRPTPPSGFDVLKF